MAEERVDEQGLPNGLPEDLSDFIMQHYKKILVLERNKAVAEPLGKMLRAEGYNVQVVNDKEEALDLLGEMHFDVLIVSEGMSADGLLIRDEVQQRGIRVSLLVMKDFGSAILSHHKGESLERIEEAYHHALGTLVGLLECFDPYVFGHSAKVSEYSMKLAEALDLPPEERERILIAAYFHDLPQLLTDFDQRRDRALPPDMEASRLPKIKLGDFLKLVPQGIDVRRILRHLKERYDGKGFPDRLQGEKIPIGSRIIATADIYVHMISGSGSRKPLKRVNAMDELRQNAGEAFDPQVVERFLALLKEELQEGGGVEERDTILVVDDSAEDSLMKLKLRDEGHRVISAALTREALKLIKENPPDLIISEVDLADLDGFQFIEYLKGEKSTRSIPFIFLSAKDAPTYMARALRLGADDYITKPFHMEVLSLKIRKILARRERQRGYQIEERRGVSGSLREMGILEIIQILAAGTKTARIDLRRETEEARIYLQDGQIISAELGDQEGEDAFYLLMSWEDGEFTIHPNLTTETKNIYSPNDVLLLSVLHRMDESRRQFSG